MSVFVTDTHALLWFTLNKHSKLSKTALHAFENAENGRGFINIPSMVLFETAILEKQARIKLNGGFLRWSKNLLGNSGFGTVPLEPEIIHAAVGYKFNEDPFDKIIVATATQLSLPLITKDAAIIESGLIEICW